MTRWWWLGVVIACHHDDKVAVGHPDDGLLACPPHNWKTAPRPSTALFGDACGGLEPAACTAKCDAGNALACTEAGVALGQQGTNYREQLRLYTHACELGDLLGCTNLGTTVRSDSPEWSPKKPNLACAADLFELTCTAGEPNGCGELAYAYIDGAGRRRDPVSAVAAFKHGCVDPPLENPVIAKSAEMVCRLFMENVESGKLGTVAPEIVQAAKKRLCDLGNCWQSK